MKATATLLPLLVLGFVAPPLVAQTQPMGSPLTLADLERLAFENNPTLRQAAANMEAAEGRALQAGLFPNPSIGYTAEEVSGGPIIRGGEHGFFIEQTCPQVLIARRDLMPLSDRYVAAAETVWRTAIQIEGLLLADGLEAPAVPGGELGSAPGLPVRAGEMPRGISPGAQAAGVQEVER